MPRIAIAQVPPVVTQLFALPASKLSLKSTAAPASDAPKATSAAAQTPKPRTVALIGADAEFRWRVAAPRRFKGIRGAQRLYRVTGV